MSKRRSQQGPEGGRPQQVAKTAESQREADEQSELGNAAIQARLTTEEVAGTEPSAEAVQRAVSHLDHALAALHLDPADPAKIGRLVDLIERSNLSERDVLVDRLLAAETTRQVVDAALERWFGASDEATRWSVDGALAGARDALLQAAPPTPSQASGPEAAWELVASAADKGQPDRSSDGIGQAVVGFCRTLSLAVMLEEEEEEESDLDAGVELDG
ncbi:MAG: hypothetical protein EA397_03605 [Deltaproteobacteria bacterium]|nr:MAG: hypothetical protein EA397_03605 [Deltaproteobacteria bacterium]